jgi:hypothetical protein
MTPLDIIILGVFATLGWVAFLLSEYRAGRERGYLLTRIQGWNPAPPRTKATPVPDKRNMVQSLPEDEVDPASKLPGVYTERTRSYDSDISAFNKLMGS